VPTDKKHVLSVAEGFTGQRLDRIYSEPAELPAFTTIMRVTKNKAPAFSPAGALLFLVETGEGETLPKQSIPELVIKHKAFAVQFG